MKIKLSRKKQWIVGGAVLVCTATIRPSGTAPRRSLIVRTSRTRGGRATAVVFATPRAGSFRQELIRHIGRPSSPGRVRYKRARSQVVDHCRYVIPAAVVLVGDLYTHHPQGYQRAENRLRRPPPPQRRTVKLFGGLPIGVLEPEFVVAMMTM
jgi:hypothetical protein